jgi:hypothetical protein
MYIWEFMNNNGGSGPGLDNLAPDAACAGKWESI